LDHFVPERDTILLTGSKLKFSFSDLGAIFKVLSGDMSMEQQDIEIFGSGSSSLGKYRIITLESCNYSCLARYRSKFLPSTGTKWEMALPEFISHVIAPLSNTSRAHAEE
jgi:hypothetical protein